MTTERGRRRRRRHAAAGGRILVGGLSASLLVALVGAMARTERPASPGPSPVVAGPAAPAPRPGAPGVRVTRTTTPATTTSHAS